MAEIISVEERVAELLAKAPPMTEEQRELAVRMLATPRVVEKHSGTRRRIAAPERAA